MGRAMSEPIKVTQEFLDEFQELCGLIGLQPDEVEDLRRVIRADFESGRRWVAMTLWVRRYCLKKWGRLPTVDECRQIGRGSCRERVGQYVVNWVVGGSTIKK